MKYAELRKKHTTLALIPKGEENAITRAELKQYGHDSNNRERIRLARRDGALIIPSEKGGYFRPKKSDKNAVIRYIRMELHREKEQHKSNKALLKAFREMYGDVKWDG